MGCSSNEHVDHVVALKEAYDSGASSWSNWRKAVFANDRNNFLCLDAGTNISKSDGNLAEWSGGTCQQRKDIATITLRIKPMYGLRFGVGERAAIDSALARNCGGPAVSTPAVSTPAVSTPAVSTPAVSTPAVSTPEAQDDMQPTVKFSHFSWQLPYVVYMGSVRTSFEEACEILDCVTIFRYTQGSWLDYSSYLPDGDYVEGSKGDFPIEEGDTLFVTLK